jgi:hypothetical protein
MINGALELAETIINHKSIIQALKNNEFRPKVTSEIFITLAETVKEQNAELEELRAEIACQTKKEGGQE